MDHSQTIDLGGVRPAHLAGTLLGYLRSLAPGAVAIIRMREDPEWALRSADLFLQHRLDWTLSRGADGTCKTSTTDPPLIVR